MDFLEFLINSFNRLLGNLLAVVTVSVLSFFPKPLLPQTPAIPPKIATPSAQLVKPPALVQAVDTLVPWGTTEKIGEHLYRTYVGQDEKMGTVEEILTALNAYRKNHHIDQALQTDENLCRFAQNRAKEQEKGLDSHKGFTEFLNKPDNWRWLGVKSIGENASFGYVLTGAHLIEWVFDADEEHRSNQLNPEWNLACAAVSETTVDILFAKR